MTAVPLEEYSPSLSLILSAPVWIFQTDTPEPPGMPRWDRRHSGPDQSSLKPPPHRFRSAFDPCPSGSPSEVREQHHGAVARPAIRPVRRPIVRPIVRPVARSALRPVPP